MPEGAMIVTKSSKSSGAKKVSPARLVQKTGNANTFGGYMKVNHRNGSFSMKKTGK